MRLIFLFFFMLELCLPDARGQDTTATASLQYARPSFVQKVFVGKNYRKAWGTPVRLRIINLVTEKGGLKPTDLGGGMQTKSLHLEDSKGTKWVLRSIDKTVDKAMKAMGIKNKTVRSFSQQMISAANPYGSLTLAPMAAAVGVLNTQPELVFVPDDPALGKYRSMFANSVCILEMQEPVFHEGDKVISTNKLLKHLKKDKNYVLDEKMLLQARLLDMLVADWDRHGDQWKWEVYKQPNGQKMVYPIPRDHDQAYFNSNGFVFGLIRAFQAHAFVGFRPALKLKQLNYKEWDFDKTLLQHLSEADWRKGVMAFQAAISDRVLEAGVRRLPAEVYAECGERMLRLLKIRRDHLPKAAMDYYKFLQTHPKRIAKEARKMEARTKKAEKIKAAKVEDLEDD